MEYSDILARIQELEEMEISIPSILKAVGYLGSLPVMAD